MAAQIESPVEATGPDISGLLGGAALEFESIQLADVSAADEPSLAAPAYVAPERVSFVVRLRAAVDEKRRKRTLAAMERAEVRRNHRANRPPKQSKPEIHAHPTG
jgi:hypothetical protein